jgi:hypothetical protein
VRLAARNPWYVATDQKVVCTGFHGRYLYAFLYKSRLRKSSEPTSSARMAKSRLFCLKEHSAKISPW